LDRIEAEKRESIRRKKINILLSRSKVGDARRVNREKEERSDGNLMKYFLLFLYSYHLYKYLYLIIFNLYF
jgi:hypothetical protein